MNKYIYLLLFFVLFYEVKATPWKKEAISRFNALIERNEANDAKGESDENDYVFFTTQYAEDRYMRANDLAKESFERNNVTGYEAKLNEFNQKLVDFAEKGTKLYVAINGDLLVVEQDVDSYSAFYEEQKKAINESFKQLYDLSQLPLNNNGGKIFLCMITPVKELRKEGNKNVLAARYYRNYKRGDFYSSNALFSSALNEAREKPEFSPKSSGDVLQVVDVDINAYMDALLNYEGDSEECQQIIEDYIALHEGNSNDIPVELLERIGRLKCEYGPKETATFNQEKIDALYQWQRDFYYNNVNDATVQDFTNYANALEKKKEIFDHLRNKTLTLKERKAMFRIVRYFNNAELESLTVDEKINMLKVMLVGDVTNMLTDNVHTFFDSKEGLLIKVLKQFTDKQANDVLGKFISEKVTFVYTDPESQQISYSESNLYQALSGVLEDWGGDDNYTAFAKELRRLVLAKHEITENTTIKVFDQKFPNAYYFMWNDNSLLFPDIEKGITTYEKIKVSGNKIDIEYKTATNCREYDTGGPEYPGLMTTVCDYESSNPINLNVFDPVVVSIGKQFDRDLPPLYTESMGESIVTYAGFLDYLKQKKSTETTIKVVDYTITGVSLAFGVGEMVLIVRAGATTGRVLIASWEIGSEVLDLIIQSESFEDWCRDSEGCNLEVIQKANLITQLATMSAGGYDIVKNWDDLVQKRRSGVSAASSGGDLAGDIATAFKNIDGSVLTFTDATYLDNIVGSLDSFEDLEDLTSSMNKLDEVDELVMHGVNFKVPNGVKVYKNKVDDKVVTVAEGLCFPAGTDILIEGGIRRNIENLKVGDTVMSFDHKDDKVKSSRIKQLFKRTTNALTKVMVGGSLLMATPEHQVFANGDYEAIQNLEKGDTLYDISGDYYLVQSVATLDSTLTVYNFEVEETHNYYAGDLSLLVHNSCNLEKIAKKLEIPDPNLSVLKNSLDDLNISSGVRGDFTKKIFESLDVDQTKKFLADFAINTDLKKLVDDPSLVDAWAIVKNTGFDDLAKNTDVLAEVSKLSAKTLDGNPLDVARLFDNGLGKTLDKVSDADKTNMLSKINEWDASKVDDLARRLGKSDYEGLADELADSELFDLYDRIAQDPFNATDLANEGGSALWTKVGKSTFFNEVTTAGKNFEKYIIQNLGDLRSKVLDKYPNLDINEYEVFTQVQMKTGVGDEYFVADLVLVKKNTDEFGQVFLDKNNVVVLESKLSSGTDLTTPQGNALTKVKSSENIFDVRSLSKTNPNGLSISNSDKLVINDFIKVSSDGQGGVIDKVVSLK